MNCSLNCNEELNIIYKGTTPTFNFSVCLDTTLIDLDNTHIVFTSGSGKADKSGSDIIVGDDSLSCSLTAEDTLAFNGTKCFIQILATMQNGQKPASAIMSIPVSSTLRGGVGW